jgi:outer membrane protein assembly factor BamB
MEGWMNHPAPGHELGKRPSRACLAAILPLVLLAATMPPSYSADSTAQGSVGVLVFLDDSDYHWADVGLEGGSSALCATIGACIQLDLPLNYSMSQYGAFVTEIGGLKAPADFSWWWYLLLWNATNGAWQEAPVGAGDLKLSAGDNICWCPNSSAPPTPDPLTRFPWTKFRCVPSNSGVLSGVSIGGLPDFRQGKVGNGPIDCSPVIARGMVFISTGGVYNWSLMKYDTPPHIYAYNLSDLNRAVWSRETTAAGWQVSSPAIGYGQVVLGTSDGKVLAFSAGNGTPLWTFSTAPSATGVTASPVIINNTVHIAAGDGQLHALSLDGRQLWNVSLDGPAYMCTPAFSEGRLFAGSDAGVLTCVALDGSVLWNFSADGKIRASPAVAGGTVVFISTVYEGFAAVRSTLFAISAENGSQLWNASIPSSTSSPAVSSGRIIFGTADGVLAYGLNGTLLWSSPTAGPVQSSPAVNGAVAYVTENMPNGSLRALSCADGRELWNFTPGWGQYLFSSPALYDKGMVFATDSGMVYHFFQSLPAKSYSVKVVSWKLPGEIRAGQRVTVRVRLENTGVAASNIQVKLHEEGRPLDVPFNISHLGPGENATAVFNWTVRAGKTDLWAEVLIEGQDYGGSPYSIKHLDIPADPAIPATLTYAGIALIIIIAVIAVWMTLRSNRRKEEPDEKK